MTGDKDRAARAAAGKRKAARIRKLNDAFRATFAGGTTVITDGVGALGAEKVAELLAKVTSFDAFTDANDPYGEHDFGAIDHEGERYFWKIDYYDPSMLYGSPDPSDPSATRRVLTIMLASEY